MLRRLLAVTMLWFACMLGAAYGQSMQVLVLPSGCGTASYTVASIGYLTVDTTGKLCTSGSGGGGGVVTGNISNAGSGVAPTSTNLGTASYNYWWNGASWDQAGGTAANGGYVQGAVAGGATDAGNPVKVGGIFNTTLPTLSTGQRGDLQLSNFGGILAATSSTAADGSTNVGANLNVGTAGSSNTSGALFNKPFLFNGATWDRARSINNAQAAGTGTAAVAIAPTSAASGGITPTVTGAAANNLVLKASAGNLYSVYATNQTATAGFLMVLNATSAPADGAVTPLECVPLPASGNAAISFGAGPPDVFSTGITAVVSSGANCFTKTTGTITAFIKGNAL